MSNEKRYQWPPPRDPDLNYRDKSRNPVQSLITALPVLMLVAGLYFYYSGESQQAEGLPIAAASVTLAGDFTGTSATSGRHYLWLQQDDEKRGLRVTSEQAVLLESLERGIPLLVKAAPHIQGSRTYWVWHIEQSGSVLIDDSEALVGAE